MSIRSYKRGAVDTMRAFQDFISKQENASKYVADEIRSVADKVSKLGESYECLIDHISQKEKEVIYKFSIPDDIRELDEFNKNLLMGILYLLGNEKDPTIEQQIYLNGIQRYMGIKNVVNDIDVSVLGTINDLNIHKILFRIVLEYLVLQKGKAYDETEFQKYILDMFSVNDIFKKETIDSIEITIKVLGLKGFSEKFGKLEDFERMDAEQERKTTADKELKEQQKKQNEKASALLALKENVTDQYKSAYALKDYLWINSREENIIINKNSSEKENCNWLPSGMFCDYAVCDNLCCVINREKNCYLIDFEKKIFRSLNFDVGELITMNYDFIIGVVTGSEIWIYNLLTDTVNKIHHYCNSVDLKDNKIYFANYDTVYEYILKTQELIKILSLEEIADDETKQRLGLGYPNCGTIEDTLFYDNKLFVLARSTDYNNYPVKRHYIYSFDLESNGYQLDADNILIYDKYGGMQKCDAGWLIITEESERACAIEPKLELKLFTCEEKQLIKLAENCGKVSELESGFIKKKTELLYFPSCPIKWGKYVFFEHDARSYHSVPAFVSIEEPMKIYFGE